MHVLLLLSYYHVCGGMWLMWLRYRMSTTDNGNSTNLNIDTTTTKVEERAAAAVVGRDQQTPTSFHLKDMTTSSNTTNFIIPSETTTMELNDETDENRVPHFDLRDPDADMELHLEDEDVKFGMCTAQALKRYVSRPPKYDDDSLPKDAPPHSMRESDPINMMGKEMQKVKMNELKRHNSREAYNMYTAFFV